MGTIKFEVDIPDFEKEISINVVIKKDGEVAYSTTSSSLDAHKIIPTLGFSFFFFFCLSNASR